MVDVCGQQHDQIKSVANNMYSDVRGGRQEMADTSNNGIERVSKRHQKAAKATKIHQKKLRAEKR